MPFSSCILCLKNLIILQVEIWDERKVFGSRGQGLKEEMLGKSPPPLLLSNGKNSNPIKIVKRDSQSVRIVSITNYLIC